MLQAPPALAASNIDYPVALAPRQMAMQHDDYPKLIRAAPEVSALLHYVPDPVTAGCCWSLWNTGARINEALALTRETFSPAPPLSVCAAYYLKQRAKRPERQDECQVRLPCPTARAAVR